MSIVFLVSSNLFNKILNIIDDYTSFLALGGDFDYTDEKEIGKFLDRLDEIKRRENKSYEPPCFVVDFNGNVRCLGRFVKPVEDLPEDCFIMIADDNIMVRKSIGDIGGQMRNEYRNYLKRLIKENK